MKPTDHTRVLFVCLGNICRSPTAEGVFTSKLEQHGLATSVAVESCGIGNWHAGQGPDERATAAAARRGYDLSKLRARQVKAADFERFDYIVAMDRMNLTELEAMRPTGFDGKLALFLSFADGVELEEVPDPYFGGDDGFSEVLDLIEQASEGLIREIVDARPAQ